MTWWVICYVILNEVKDLSESKTVDRHVDLEIFRFAQDDNHNIMGYIFVTREVEGQCRGWMVCKPRDPSLRSGWHTAWMRLPRFVLNLAMTHITALYWTLYAVILNEVKDLLADDTLSTAALVGSEEILRYAQDDILSERLPRLAKPSSQWQGGLICHSERSEESPRCVCSLFVGYIFVTREVEGRCRGWMVCKPRDPSLRSGWHTAWMRLPRFVLNLAMTHITASYWTLYDVIVNEVKNLSERKTVERLVDLEIFRFAQDDNHNIMGYIFVTHEQRRHPRRCGAVGVFWGGEIVILNEVKNLLAVYIYSI